MADLIEYDFACCNPSIVVKNSSTLASAGRGDVFVYLDGELINQVLIANAKDGWLLRYALVNRKNIHEFMTGEVKIIEASPEQRTKFEKVTEVGLWKRKLKE